MPEKPLADKLRPTRFEDMAGDEKLFSETGVFSRMIKNKFIPNMVFFGASGTGKTTAAGILAAASGKELRRLNATTASIADIRDVVAATESLSGRGGVLLYLDEIQYFNKKQQQSLLEFIEDGRITLIASTTENPYFYVYPAILSRCAVFEFKPLCRADIIKVLCRAAKESGASASSEALEAIADGAGGDARRALGLFESLFRVCSGEMTPEKVKLFIPEVMGMSGFDRDGDGHYDLLSAFQKSIRGSDANAAVFYLAKLLSGGDLISVCRRLQVIASEDIGAAYPMAAVITRACVESARELGLPEAVNPLSNAAVMLATAPKSNSAVSAYYAAEKDVTAGKGATPPSCLRDSHYGGASKLGRGEGYKYPHVFPNHYVPQQYLPDDIADASYYEFADNKTEQAAKAYWSNIKNENKK